MINGGSFHFAILVYQRLIPIFLSKFCCLDTWLDPSLALAKGFQFGIFHLGETTHGSWPFGNPRAANSYLCRMLVNFLNYDVCPHIFQIIPSTCLLWMIEKSRNPAPPWMVETLWWDKPPSNWCRISSICFICCQLFQHLPTRKPCNAPGLSGVVLVKFQEGLRLREKCHEHKPRLTEY